MNVGCVYMLYGGSTFHSVFDVVDVTDVSCKYCSLSCRPNDTEPILLSSDESVNGFSLGFP